MPKGTKGSNQEKGKCELAQRSFNQKPISQHCRQQCQFSLKVNYFNDFDVFIISHIEKLIIS